VRFVSYDFFKQKLADRDVGSFCLLILQSKMFTKKKHTHLKGKVSAPRSLVGELLLFFG